ncbi:MAG TPA: formate dehydrogenase accessory sulfurtransferase FdhD [Candidatus Eisenbacteria bacterium]|nr:formate dehydrogenase accessory sulfurtransferase FdhD [Candidatus Eisenbacteria bacterium]
MARSIARALAVPAWRPGRGAYEDRVAIEEPLEIRVNGAAVAVTLRTPGEDLELAAGFALTEGIARAAAEIQSVDLVDDVPPEARGNVVNVRVGAPGASDGTSRLTGRPAFISAACGVCGRGTLEAVRRRAEPLPDGPLVARAILASLPERLRTAQPTFDETGGLHAAGLFDLSGTLLAAREDVGRHNAVDKLVGWAALGGRLPLRDALLCVSGRAGFEILLKAWIAAIPVVASVSAPSHLAVALAEEANLTLLGFVRGGTFAAYTGRERIQGAQ